MFLKQVLKRDVKMESAHMPDEAGLNHADAHCQAQHGLTHAQYPQSLSVLDAQVIHDSLLIVVQWHQDGHLKLPCHESAASAFGSVIVRPLLFDSH